LLAGGSATIPLAVNPIFSYIFLLVLAKTQRIAFLQIIFIIYCKSIIYIRVEAHKNKNKNKTACFAIIKDCWGI